jgi:hypothetical protein
MALRLRFDYGRIVPWVQRLDGQLSAVAGPDAAWLTTPVPFVRRFTVAAATFTLRALLGTGIVAEAKAWREWLLRAAAGDPADLQIMYGIDGTHRLPEYTLDRLPGYEGSAPVRVGNAATGQVQRGPAAST